MNIFSAVTEVCLVEEDYCKLDYVVDILGVWRRKKIQD